MAWPPPIRETFTYADGSISGRQFGAYTWGGPMFIGHTIGQIASNAFEGFGGADRSAVLNYPFGPNLAVRIKSVGAMGGFDLLYITVRINVRSFPADSATSSRYTLQYTDGVDELRMRRVINGVNTDLTPVTGTIAVTLSPNDTMGFDMVESGGATLINVYKNDVVVTTYSDNNVARPVAAGPMGIELENANSDFDDLAFEELNPIALSFSRHPKVQMLDRPQRAVR